MAAVVRLRIGAIVLGATVVVATCLCSTVHWATWIRPGGESLDPFIAAIGNAIRSAAVPGWLAISILTGSPAQEGDLSHVIAAQGLSWVGYGLAVFALMWLLRRRAGPDRLDGAFRPDRRRAMITAACCAGGVVPMAGAARATVVDPWRLTLRRYRIPISGLPAAFDGLRIAQISDTHLCPRTPSAFIAEAVEIALAQSPDLVALTGDYISQASRYAEASAALFRPISAAGVPMVGVLGNHDWWHNGRRMSDSLRSVGVRMIDNSRVFLSADRAVVDEPPDVDALCIAGLGDLEMDQTDPHRAMSGVSPSMARIVLAHEPDSSENAEVRRYIEQDNGRIDLMLSGHTHGGQVAFPFIGPIFTASRFGNRFAGGVCDGRGFPVVVSRGVGMSVLPVRFGVPPEVVIVELARA